jgi:TIR domain
MNDTGTEHPLQPPFEAYVGAEPFLFVSYSHADSQIVYAEIERLHRLGFRLWYDEGIDPGNEWQDEVAKALNECSLFVVFISPRAIKSKNVRDEINFAINRNKPFIAVHLEETQLPEGLELRMGAVQAVMRYRMPDDRYYRQMEKALPSSLIVTQPRAATESQRSPALPSTPPPKPAPIDESPQTVAPAADVAPPPAIALSPTPATPPLTPPLATPPPKADLPTSTPAFGGPSFKTKSSSSAFMGEAVGKALFAGLLGYFVFASPVRALLVIVGFLPYTRVTETSGQLRLYCGIVFALGGFISVLIKHASK